ncbi:CHAT domain-containing protein [Mycena leptocephala]|nr:CHAT domain-containing protein [Mycena leptocephala]
MSTPQVRNGTSLAPSVQLTNQTHLNTPEVKIKDIGNPVIETAKRSRSFLRKYYDSGRVKLSFLESAIRYSKQAVGRQPNVLPYLQVLAVCLTERYWCSGNWDDLQESLDCNQKLVDRTPSNHQDFYKRLQNLATSFRDRYRCRWNLGDLRIAIKHSRTALEKDDKDPSGFQNLAVSLTELYWELKNGEDLEEAIKLHEKARDLTSENDHDVFPKRLQNLATSLRDRYQAHGKVQDLEYATNLDHCALDLIASANSLAHAQHVISDFEVRLDPKEIELVQQKIKFLARTPENSDEYDDHFHALNAFLCDRNVHPAEWVDRLKQRTSDLAHQINSDRAGFAHNLALSSKNQYDVWHKETDLDAALENMQYAVGLLAENDPHRPQYLHNLAVLNVAKYRATNDLRHLEDADANYRKSFTGSTVRPIWSWDAANDWAYIEKEHSSGKYPKAYLKAFGILTDILWVGNSLDVRLAAFKRTELTKTTADAVHACIERGDLCCAVEFAERGMAITFQQRLQLNAHTHELLSADAIKLDELSAVLINRKHPNLNKVETERQRLLEKIRQQPGLQKYLCPKDWRDLRQVSKDGPVVILNSHRDSCDAILLHSGSEPIRIKLEDILQELGDKKKSIHQLLTKDQNRDGHREEIPGSAELIPDFKSILIWLWDKIVSPIYTELKSNQISGGRLWWCPMGEFTGLPLHASHAANGHTGDAADRFIQSYTPNLGLLLEARQNQLPHLCPEFGVIGVTHSGSNGLDPLPSVEQEVGQIADLVKHAGFKISTLSDPNTDIASPTVDNVAALLQESSWVHFACHGQQSSRDPAKSYLRLYEGCLELQVILKMSLHKAEFAFLATCQSAMGNPNLANESFHMGGGFIAAGFRAVIGTMWTMKDYDGPVISQAVYIPLLEKAKKGEPNSYPKAEDTARALHFALKDFKKHHHNSYARWIPFIHIGV